MLKRWIEFLQHINNNPTNSQPCSEKHVCHYNALTAKLYPWDFEYTSKYKWFFFSQFSGMDWRHRLLKQNTTSNTEHYKVTVNVLLQIEVVFSLIIIYNTINSVQILCTYKLSSAHSPHKYSHRLQWPKLVGRLYCSIVGMCKPHVWHVSKIMM